MEDYEVEVSRAGERDMERLPPGQRHRVETSILSLGTDPRQRRAVKLKGGEGLYRLRLGDYRVLYKIDDRNRLVTVYAIGHRREVYRRMR